jgi:predicted Zn-dependent protease
MNEARTARIKILKQYLEEDPGDQFSRYVLALEVIEAGQANEAICLLVEVIRQNTEFLAAYYQLGRAYEMIQHKDAAVETYRNGIAVARRQNNLKTESELKTALYSIQEEDD